MKLRLKEEPKEWRKSTLLTLAPVAILSSLLCWRHVVSMNTWRILLAVLTGIALAACVQPRWFRGYYRVSMRAGFWLSQAVARVVLALIFMLLITPLGLILRVCGKDLLRLKRTKEAATYWTAAKQSSSLDQLF